MFGSRRKKGAPLPPLNATTANPNAATAALSAFKRRGSNGSLSAAAAAAALKARPTTPTNVAEVQTKRTARRSASVSSAGTAPELGDRPGSGLQRRGSSGSLTERTFRSQSPHRPSSSGGQPRSSFNTEDMPPVPSIPKDVEARESAKAGKKSLGFKSPPLRVASQKLGKEASGSWFGSAKAGDPSNVRTSDAPLTNPQPLEKEREGRPSSRGSSINFSYPARVRLGSPPPDSPTIAEEESRSQQPPPAPPAPQPEVQRRTSKRASTLSPARGGGVRSPRPASIASDRELVYDPNSRRMVPRADLLAVEQNVIDASERRPKKQKQVASRAGSHLAQGTMGRPHGSAVDNGVENEAQKAAAASLRSHRAEEHHRAPQEDEYEYEYEQPAMEVVPASPRQTHRKIISPEPTRQGQRTSLSPASSAPEVYAGQFQPTERRSSNQFLGRKPSVVREEEEEPEAEELDSHAIASQSSATESPPQQRQEIHIISSQPIAIPHAAPAELPAAPTPPPAEPPAAFRIERGAVSQPEAIRRERAHSNSPARTAHFGPVQDSLTVRHSPPPRSISPRKSALKQQSPSRGASPEDDTSEASGSAVQAQEPVLPRKKSVRVSFDDQSTVVVGEAATPEQSDSPVLLSPQNSKRVPWFSSITRSKKKEIPSLDDDEVMQPRPALPSFGSVREKKQASKEPEERPLVRPVEAAHSPPLPASPALKPSIASVTEAELVGQSSDHAIGALLQEQGPRTEANISKLREPLPPVVTSIEGGGYMSDTTSSSESESELIADTPRLEPEMSQASTLITEPESQPPPLNGSAEVSEVPGQGQTVEAKGFAEEQTEGPLPEPVKTPERVVPSIAITQPSPRLPDGKTPPRDYLDVPGGFPDTDSELEEPPKPLDTQTVAAQPEEPSTPVRRVTFEPVMQKDDTRAAAQTASTALATTVPIHQDDDSDSSGVYSDAYEDLSDFEGDGFQSLDAVVESPLITTPPQSAFAKARAAQMQGESPSPSPRPVEEKPQPLTLAPEVLGPTQSPPDDWEVAKAYWRSLTADKRAQLEKEAIEDAGIEGDLEEVKQEDKKPRRKKSVEKRAAEKKVIEEQRHVDPERTYMIKPGTRVEADSYSSAPAKTMRKQQQAPAPATQPAARMRKSMRGAEQPQPRASATVGGVAAGGAGGAPRIRKSMRTNGPEPQQRSAPAARPVSYQPPSSAPRQPQGHARTMSDQSYQSSQASARAAVGVAKAMQPKLTRRGSDSSESSFKRARTRSGEGFGFRRTMRGQGHEPSNSQDSGRPSSSRFSLRSLSPTGSPFRRSSTVDSPPVSMGNRMKTSMRGTAEPQRKGSRLSSLGFSSKPKATGKTRKASRFGDSSDEDEPRQGFRSRFDDSSDEDAVPEKLPPLAVPKNARGNIAATRTTIPASQTLHEEDEQSSDLPDSDEERKQPHRKGSGRQISQATGTVQRSGSGRGALVSSPTSPVSPGAGGRPVSHNRRSSFMSALRRKKPDGAGKISRGEMMDSAARRDTNLERSASELNAIRTNSQRGQASSPKLQKRTASFGTPARNSSWPLPDEEDDDEPELPAGEDEEKHLQRPSTSGNLEGGGKAASRPGFLQRRTMSTQGTIDTHGVGGEKKKKKFGALRRMFKLDD